MSQAQIAEHVQMSPGAVCQVIGSPIFQHELSMKREQFEQRDNIETIRTEQESAQRIRDATLKAAKRLILGVSSDDERIALKAAESILDRGGVPKVVKNDGQQTASFNITTEKLAIIQQTMEMVNVSKKDSN